MKILKKEEIIRFLADKNNQEQTKVKDILITLGLNVIIDEARRLQISQAFEEKKLIASEEPIPTKFIQKSYKSIIEN